ncbi:MAG: DNA-processing protein DprA [Patescibacteria group bacterium]
MDRIGKVSDSTITSADPRYPPLLRTITPAPRQLFIRGTLPDPTLPAVAVVGTRRFTRYGKEWTERIAADLVRAGVIIVSGLARGIDSTAHLAAVEARAPTIAVLGSGVDDDSLYPRQNLELAHRILDTGGCLVSEYPEGTQGTPYTFPERNRIIAGLSLGTLVTEAPIKSGALITARHALDYNREVFAIPHPLGYFTGEGCNELLSQGAHFVQSARDILEVLEIPMPEESRGYTPQNETEAQLIAALSREPMHIDALIAATGIASRDVVTALTMLELKGAVKNLGEMRFAINSPLPSGGEG